MCNQASLAFFNKLGTHMPACVVICLCASVLCLACVFVVLFYVIILAMGSGSLLV